MPMSSKKLALFSVLFVFLLLSCDLFSPAPAAPTTDPQEAIDRAIRETQQALTMVAFSVQQTVAAGGGGGDGGAPPPLPTYTFQPTYTTQFTVTPSKVTVTVSVNTNCRTGPGNAYPIVGALTVGQTAEVVGRSAASDNWIVKLPGKTSTCWLWGYYATVEGDTSKLPVFDPPPTPTPEAGFTIDFLPGLVNCFGWYGFRFQLKNTGSITWESYMLVVTDNTTSITRSYIDDFFSDSSLACVIGTSLWDLEPGEVGVAGNWTTGLFNYVPTGHNMTAVFKLCSQNGLLGTCVEKSISFVP